MTFQVFLPPPFLNTGGAYRADTAYLERTAQRIAMLQRIAFDEGMNCYIETHIDRISEDIQAFCEIIDRCPVDFELNGDLSHYLYRGINQGAGLKRVLSKIGHMHQRMARQHGDLSADVPDPAKDWEEKGVTFQAFEYAKPALVGGLSSRVIMGESGPIHLVKDALGLDAKLVPLWREMARHADAQIGAGGAVPHAGAAPRRRGYWRRTSGAGGEEGSPPMPKQWPH